MSPAKRAARRPSRRLARGAATAAGLRGRALLAVLVGLTLLAAAAAAVGLAWARLPDPSPLATRLPTTTALVEQRRAEARRDHHAFHPDLRPVGLDRISPRLAEAVLLSEDAAFFGHGGFDWREIRNAAEQNLKAGRTVRGASTITQQVAKNLWLGTERSWQRKAREALLAVKLERTLSKRRILALYLNVAEWGDGVFGAEAAAQHWFGTSAGGLSPAQAAALASMLPAPRRAALSPAPAWLARRARRVLDRMAQYGKIDEAEHARARTELESILRAPAEENEAGDEPPPDE